MNRTTLQIVMLQFGRKDAFVQSFGDGVEHLLSHPNTMFFSNDNVAMMDNRVVALDLTDSKQLSRAFALQPDSEFKHFFNFYLLKLEETGVAKRIKEKWLLRKTIADEELMVPLGYDTTVFVDSCLALGMGLQLSSFFAKK